jgi:hypothetical protein
MSRTALTLVGALALVAAPALAVAATSPDRPVALHSASRQPVTVDFTVAWNGGHSRTVDLGRHGLSVGDEFFTTDQPAYATRTKERIGSLDGGETIVAMAHQGTVRQDGTLRLHGGLVMFAGIVRHTDQPFRIAVTGGTGRYAHTTGQLVVLSEDDQTKTTNLELQLDD